MILEFEKGCLFVYSYSSIKNYPVRGIKRQG